MSAQEENSFEFPPAVKNQDEDPYESEEYQKFAESMVPHCHCRESNRPCDGVLAGGLCDNIQDEKVLWDDDDLSPEDF